MLKRRKQVEGGSVIANEQTDDSTRKPLRLWPGVVIVVVQLLAWFGVPLVLPDDLAAGLGYGSGFFGGLAVVAWWAFFSRAPQFERWIAVVLMVVALMVTSSFLHESVAKGNFGFLFFIYAIPILSLAFVIWAVVSRHLADGPRRGTMAATILLACGVFTLVRSDGLSGTGTAAEFKWRWAQTAEERLLAQASDEPEVSGLPTAPAVVKTGAEWPGFRGPNRDGIVPGLQIKTDWIVSPPVELWRRPIGPGVSSIVVRGNLLYTQEQRGDDEVVACYNVTTGEPVWIHRDTVRFWDSHVGAGPRATPALGDGRVYTLGATGILNALDAENGTVVWSRNAASDVDSKVPYFGFVNSPLVVDDVVIVAVRGTLVAYDLATGDPRWFGPAGGGSFSSPHLMTIDGVTQILMLRVACVTSLALADGTVLWEHLLPGGYVQPVQIPNSRNDILISMINDASGFPIGIRRIAVAQGPGGWTIEERWTSTRLKPTFSAFVVHKGHAFGFDGRILACIDVEDGKRKWKGGRYGKGQLILLPDQDLLLVLSEKGELALVKAIPDQFTEIGMFQAIKGKTWNQPTLVGDILLIRNRQEMAAFRLSLVGN